MIKYNTTRRSLLISLVICATWLVVLASAHAAEQSSREIIVFLGDSITAAGGYVRNIDAVLKKRDPKNAPRVIGRGKSSETVSGLSEAYHPGFRPCIFARLDKILKDTNPTWVVACYGINCGIYHPYDEKRFAAYKAGIEKLISKVHASGARLVLLTAPPYARSGPAFPEGTDAATREKLIAKANAAAAVEANKNPRKYGYRTPYAYYDSVMARYAQWLETLSDRDNVWVVNLRTAMLPRLKECYNRDPIHPNGTGHGVMADSFLKQWSRIQKEAAKIKLPTATAPKASAWPGKKGDFRSFAKYSFQNDKANCMVVVPTRIAKGKPWIWRARFWGHEPQFDVALLNKGYHLVYCDVGNLYGSPKAVARWDSFYKYLTEEHGFAKKVVLEGMSRGGLIIYNWAIKNPEKVAVMYGDAPVMDFKSWPGAGNGGIHKSYGFKSIDEAKAYKGNPVDNLAVLAKAGVPIIHVVGDADNVVPIAQNTTLAEKRYKALGGVFEVIHKKGVGHHPHSLKNPAPLVQFVEKYYEGKK